jgi:hypothetical protein
MNNFNNVFMAIKEHCGSSETDVIDCFDKIAKQADIPMKNLDFYLICLTELGLINYIKPRKKVILTEQGKNTATLFMSGPNAYIPKNSD